MQLLLLFTFLAVPAFAAPPACLDQCFREPCGDGLPDSYYNFQGGGTPEGPGIGFPYVTIANGTLWTDCMCLDYVPVGPNSALSYAGVAQCVKKFCVDTDGNKTNRSEALSWINQNMCTVLGGINSSQYGTKRPTSDWIPWSWYIRSQSPFQSLCATRIMETYAITNAASGVLSAIAGYQRCSKRNSSSWRYSWVLSVALSFAANIVIAFLIKSTPNYDSGFQIWELVIFLTTRPRVSWIFGSILTHVKRVRASDGQEWHPWQTWFYTQFISETILSFVSAYTMGLMVAFATKSGQYTQDPKTRVGMRFRPMLMYGPALAWLVLAALTLPVALYLSIRVITHRKGKPLESEAIYSPASHIEERYEDESNIQLGLRSLNRKPPAKKHQTVSRQKAKRVSTLSSLRFSVATCAYFMIPLYISSWIFSIGFFKMIGPFYCPPRLVESSAIWSGFTVIGAAFGSLV